MAALDLAPPHHGHFTTPAGPVETSGRLRRLACDARVAASGGAFRQGRCARTSVKETAMPTRSQTTGVLLATAGLAVGFLAGIAFGQVSPPQENKGQSEVLLQSLDLTGEMDSVNGRPLRLRKVTLQPGGVLGIHTHRDRPAVSYFLQGEVTYHQDGKPDVVVHPGEGFAEGKATTHWAENRGSVPAIWIAADIPVSR